MYKEDLEKKKKVNWHDKVGRELITVIDKMTA